MVQLTVLEAQSSAGTSGSISTQERGHYQRTMKDRQLISFPFEWSVPVPVTQRPPRSPHLLNLLPWTPVSQPWQQAPNTQITETQYPNLNSHILLYPSEVLCFLFPATSNSITDVGVTRSPGWRRIQL